LRANARKVCQSISLSSDAKLDRSWRQIWWRFSVRRAPPPTIRDNLRKAKSDLAFDSIGPNVMS
jgi:hypothetical protein